MLQGLKIGQDFLFHELLGRLCHQSLFSGQILRYKHQIGLGFGEQIISTCQVCGQ